MMKMLIRMDSNKINIEQRFNLNGIYDILNKMFLNLGLICMENGAESLVYRDNGNVKDYGSFGRIVNTLKKQSWFMENVTEWRLYDSDESDDPEEFNEEDLLSRYQRRV
ncbi:MAG: hypothetical protein ACLTC4_07160 [Hungatella hathewayi]|uniref:Uncharacterized protein n=1 Tax=Hungatella hathewayi WAL-18680 TaxID=742737 RepID=G5IKB0_9FIRM|nr:hypothetical protein [Hungatella hathewayi]EHI58065.1 hypothetical protein HMPREF9473_03938 [ [Hungatella hathewayi WAL-18680]MBS4983250.1 hypothetical protein [Hungatella hathewayi]